MARPPRPLRCCSRSSRGRLERRFKAPPVKALLAGRQPGHTALLGCGCIEARVCHGSIGAHLQTTPLHAICLHDPLQALSLPVKLFA